MKSYLQYLKECFYLLGNSRKKLPWLMLLFLASSVLDLIGLGLIAPYVSLALNPEPLVEGGFWKVIERLGLPLERDAMLIQLGCVLLVVFLVKAIAAIFINRTIITFSQLQQLRIRSFLMQAYQRLPYTEYLRRNSAEYVYSVQQLTGQFSNGVVLIGLKALCEGTVGLVILVMLAWTNGPVLGILACLLGAMIFGYDRLFRRNMRIYGQKANQSATRMIQGIHEGIEGLKEIRILGKESHFYQVVREGAEVYSHNHIKAQVISSAPRYLLEFLMIAFVVLAVVGTLLSGQNLQALIPMLAVFAVAGLRLVPIANVVSSSLIQLRFNRHTVSRLYADLLELESMENRVSSSADRQYLYEPFKELVLQNVRFHYPGTDKLALNDISLTIRAGESIGLVGPSGSGKTTLVDVLLGLLEPQQGRILYNGHPLKSALADWRPQVAYLPQQILLIDSSLRCNVALGVGVREIDESRLLDALRQACLLELVEQLPEGVDTLLGERGVRLSGGQRQRIALARAFYHERNVLVMDEATSALDNETEREVVEGIQLFKGEKTMIVIAHRLTTVQHCDRIYRVKEGRITDVGTFQQVMALNNAKDKSKHRSAPNDTLERGRIVS